MCEIFTPEVYTSPDLHPGTVKVDELRAGARCTGEYVDWRMNLIFCEYPLSGLKAPWLCPDSTPKQLDNVSFPSTLGHHHLDSGFAEASVLGKPLSNPDVRILVPPKG